MSNISWIKLHKKITDWQWYGKSETFHLFIHCLINANYKDGYYQGRLIKRGQLVVGRKKLAEKLGLSERNVRTCLNDLKTTNELTIITTNKYSIITICKYDSYQMSTGKKEVSSDQQSDQHFRQQTTTSKEYKKYNSNNIVKLKKENDENNSTIEYNKSQGNGFLLERILARKQAE
jgi:DNA replication protein DnaD